VNETTKRIVWKENVLVSLRVRRDLYTIGQMLHRPYMRFFRIRSQDGRWTAVDLNEVGVLFTVSIGAVVVQELVDRKLEGPSVVPNRLPFEKYWIKPNLSFGTGAAFKGGRLIELAPGVGSARAPVVKPDLTLAADRERIDAHELTNMWGARDLVERLSTFFDTGDDRDPMKAALFDAPAGPARDG
jgi:hypothetical protein